jgi:hypothetical protein
VLEVAITVELPECDKTIPAFTEYQTRLENALAKFVSIILFFSLKLTTFQFKNVFELVE